MPPVGTLTAKFKTPSGSSNLGLLLISLCTSFRGSDVTARGWQLNLGRLNDKGGDLHSSTEEVDANTAAGKFVRGMFGEMLPLKATASQSNGKTPRTFAMTRASPTQAHHALGTTITSAVHSP
jgi:hypothetical protein